MLLSEKEVEIKTKLWFAENGDFLKELEGIIIITCPGAAC